MITDEVESLYLELKSIIGLTKLIGTGREVIPLKKEEVDFLTAFGKERQVSKCRQEFWKTAVSISQTVR